jgi:hypothetical protein
MEGGAMGIKTTVGQIGLMGNGRYHQPSGILVDERALHLARGRSRGNFYVLVEISGPELGRDVIAEQVTQAMRDAYYGCRGSVTAGLQQAIRLANNLLFDENRNSLPGERRTAGVSCVVVRDEDLFIAQAGPTAVYHAHGNQVKRYPEVSPWLDGIPLEEMDAARVGDRRDLDVDLFHAQVSSGDTVVLADSALACHAPSQAWPTLLAQTSVDLLLDELQTAVHGMEVLALVVRLGAEEARQAPAQRATAGSAPQELSAPIQPLGAQLSQRISHLRLGHHLQVAGRALLMVLGGLWTALLTFLGRMVPGQISPSETSRRQTSTVKKAGTRAKKRRKDRAADTAPSDPVQRVLIGLAIAIPLVVAVVVIVTLVQRGQSRREEREALWQEARDRAVEAEYASDPATARPLLTEALGFLDQFLEVQPDDAEALGLKSEIQAQLDLINRVKRIEDVVELNAYAGDADLTRVVVEGMHVFVLDQQSDTVYHHLLDEQQDNALRSDSRETVLTSKGQQVGDVVAGDLWDMVWMPTGPDRQRASLVILESGGALLDYDPATGELVSMRLLASERWPPPVYVGSHTGRFYLLDSAASMIWRYSPTPDGYSAGPEEWLQAELDLTGVVDMAIGDSIYLLYANGTLQKLSMGAPDTFDTQDWDTPPRDPAALFTKPPDDTQWVYVADRGNARIVQCNKEGRFEGQFQLTESQAATHGDILAHATSLFVDEPGGNAYLLSGHKLYLLALPMPG